AVCLLIMLEPNMSVTMCVGALMIGMIFLGGASKKSLAAVCVPVLFAVPALIAAEPYRLDRLSAFLNPWASPQEEGYQLIQSLYALGNGNWFGTGLFRSRQKYRFLPFSESDFILSVIGEETGFFGVLALFFVIGFVVWRGFRIAGRCEDLYGYLLVAGITLSFAVQSALNALVVSGSIPPTGLPLPLISAGNTSLIVTMTGMGLVYGVSRHNERKKFIR
ncbi:MAG: FtsW/RodA/SpoVE family cell cycle protein, partial [Candidatus Gallimonas sp.]